MGDGRLDGWATIGRCWLSLARAVGVAVCGMCVFTAWAADCPIAADGALAADGAVAEARALLDGGQRAQALLLLQRMAAAAPEDCAVRDLLVRALRELQVDAAGYEMPATAQLGGRPWWSRAGSAVQHAGWLALEAGRDSNINSATARDTIELPLINYRSLALSPLLVRRASDYLGLEGGLAGARPLTPVLSLNAGVAGAARYNLAEAAYLPQSVNAWVGAEARFGAWRLSGAATVAQRRIGRFRLLDRQEVSLGVGVEASPGLEARIGVIHGSSKFPLFNGVHTEDRAAEASVRHAASGLALSTRIGAERSGGEIRDLDRDFSAYAIEWTWAPRSDGLLRIGLGRIRSTYLVDSALFVARRQDKVSLLSLAYTWRFQPGWSLAPKVIVEQNDSNIPLIAFRRRQLALELRRDW